MHVNLRKSLFILPNLFTLSSIFCGFYAIVLSRRGRERFARTIGRSGGSGASRAGRLLGWLGLCMGISAGLAVGFYGLLTLFAKS